MKPLINAMAVRKPVIVLQDCGADEYIRNGETGVVLLPGDVRGLRRELEHILQDNEYARRLGERACEAASEFTPYRYADGLLRLMESTCR